MKPSFKPHVVILALTLVASAAGVFAKGQSVFTQSVSGLTNDEQDLFVLGKSFFRIPWVQAPASTTARDGLGPLFNANTCLSCHPKNGRGRVFSIGDELASAAVVRLSIANNQSAAHQKILRTQGSVPEPNYGGQIQTSGTTRVAAEAVPTMTFANKTLHFADGTPLTLRAPTLKLNSLNYGQLHNDAILSVRIAPALAGLGLIEQITDAQILANEDIFDANRDGISGKANRVFSAQTGKIEIGRYAWKAATPTLIHQIANAAATDMGLSNPLNPAQPCTLAQHACLDAPTGGRFELPQARLQAMGYYLSNLRPPRAKKLNPQARALFTNLGCAACHLPEFKLQTGKIIRPYSDFLLHDMGADLADGRTEFLATGREWRTPPLWGLGEAAKLLGSEANLLHDGRAQSIEAAIAWHGGEARQSQQRFMQLPAKARAILIKFIGKI